MDELLVRGSGILHDFVFIKALAFNEDIRGSYSFNENVATFDMLRGVHGELKGL